MRAVFIEDLMRTLQTVTVENFLSLRRATTSLSSLNVLVGPNGSGKTNFLRIFQFLGEVARRDLAPAIHIFDGFDQLRFRGESSANNIKIEIKGLVTEHSSVNAPDEYEVSFSERRTPAGVRYYWRRETILLKRTRGRGRRITINGSKIDIVEDKNRLDKRVSIQPASSGLSTIRKLGDEYGASQVNELAEVFEDLRLYEVDVDRARQPSRHLTSDRLAHDASNLAPYLLWLSRSHPNIFAKLCEDVAYVLPSFERFEFVSLSGAHDGLRVDIKERHLRDFTPLGRSSFGTVRAIALFAMLHDPSPPRLTCLEEVDHGLHPHALDRVVERLRDAANKTQLIIATHSPALVNRLEPDELIIFEKEPRTGSTRIVDISPEQLEAMKRESGYGLGELWFSGTLGGGL